MTISNEQVLSEIGLSLQSTAGEASAGVVPVNFAYPPGNVLRYGASTSISDNSTAFTNAMKVGASVVYVPKGTYSFTSGIVIPFAVELRGDGCFASNPQAGGTVLSFANAVANCVTINNATNNGSSNLRGICVTRVGGAPPAGSIGVLCKGGYDIVLEEVFSLNHAIGFAWASDVTSTLGCHCNATKLYTGKISDTHIQHDTWAEIFISECRFGMNGGGDYNSNSYIRIQGGSTSNVAGGPNTFKVSKCQFNQGANTANRWLAFQNQTPGSISDIEIFSFVDCYIEDDVVGIFSDSTWPSITNLFMDSVVFNPSSSVQQFMSLNSATTLNDLHISNCNIKCAFTLAPASQFNFVQINNTHFLGAVSVTGVSNSTYSSTGNIISNGLTYAGSFGALVSVGDILSSGSFTLSATGTGAQSIRLNGSTFASGSWTPALSSAGGSGITYSRQAALYEINGNFITVFFSIILTGLGTASGAISLTGLPFPSSSRVSVAGAGGSLANTTNLTGTFTGPMTVLVNTNATTAVLTTYTTAGPGNLTASQLTATSAISGSFSYEWQ